MVTMTDDYEAPDSDRNYAMCDNAHCYGCARYCERCWESAQQKVARLEANQRPVLSALRYDYTMRDAEWR